MVRIQEILVEGGMASDSVRPQFDAIAKKVNAASMLKRQKCTDQIEVMSHAGERTSWTVWGSFPGVPFLKGTFTNRRRWPSSSQGSGNHVI